MEKIRRTLTFAEGAVEGKIGGQRMANEKQLIYAKPIMQNGWHLVKTGESNRFICSMSLADVPTVDAVPVVHGRWKEGYLIHKYGCSCCGTRQDMISSYCPHCGAKMDGGNDNA